LLIYFQVDEDSSWCKRYIVGYSTRLRLVNLRTTAVKTFFRKMAAKLKRFSIENWGFPFILGFLVLLITSAVLLAAGPVDFASVADLTAIFAYFSLLIGVILQIICFSKNRKKSVPVLPVS
jgi:hypothetical protein